jgi:hypothetical protein
MLTRAAPLIVGIALAVGCESGPALPLPPAVVLVEDSIGSVTVAADHLYWTAGGGGEANHRGRVMRMARGGAAAPELLAAEQFNPASIVVGTEAIYWGNLGDFVSCGSIMSLRPGGAPQAIAQELVCHGRPVVATDGTVTAHGLGEGGSALVEIDEATGAVSPRVTTDGIILALAPTPGAFYLIVGDQGGGYLARFVRGPRVFLRYNTRGIRQAAGLTVAGDHLYWVDGNYTGEPRQVYRARLDGTDGPELIAEVEPELWIGQPTYVGGAVWLRGTSGSDEDEAGWLLRVDTDDGSIDRFALAYLPASITPDGDDLIVLTRPRQGPDGVLVDARIVAQPLP